MFLWSVLSLAFADDGGCPDPLIHIEQMGGALLAGRHDAATARRDALEDTLTCHGLPSADLLSRVWLTEGVRLHVLGDHSGAQRAFATSQRLHPQPWPPQFGQAIAAVYADAIHLEGTGQLTITPLPDGVWTAVNGSALPLPAAIEQGAHLVQVMAGDQTVLQSHFVMLPAGEVLEVTADNLPLPPPEPRHSGWLVGAGVSAATAGGMALLARQQSTAMAQATTVSGLDQAFARQKAFAGLSYGLLGLSVVGVGLHVAH